MPGLWDTHVHLGQWTLARGRLDTSRGALGRGGGRARGGPGRRAARARPVIGWGHRPGTWPREPTAADLDDAAGVTPVVLSPATATTPGSTAPRRRRSACRCGRAWSPRRSGSRPTSGSTTLTDDRRRPDAYRATLDDAAALGRRRRWSTSSSPARSTRWRERWSQGCDRLRMRAAVYADQLDAVLAAGLRTGDPLLPGDDRLTMGPLKIISDGSLNTGTAWCHHPYAPAPLPTTRPAPPTSASPSSPTCSARAHAGRPRGRDPRHRRRGGRRRADGVRAHRRPRLHRARAAGRARRRRADGPARRCAPASSRTTSSTTATSPSRSGRTAPTGASRSAGCSTPASRSASAPTPRSPRSTRGSRSTPPSAVPATTGRPGTPSRRSPGARRSPRRSTATLAVRPGAPGDLVVLDADPLDRDPATGRADGRRGRGRPPRLGPVPTSQ